MGVFDIIGPIMVGPSSSHTAGAVRLGKMARTILGESPLSATIILYGSFAKTGKGHGTDKALVAGLLGFSADDPRIRDSLELAAEAGLTVNLVMSADGGQAHPNTAEFHLAGASGRTVQVTGVSTGGGRIAIIQINDFQVEFTGDYHTLIAIYPDKPGIVAEVTRLLAQENVNIAFMKVSRRRRGDQALMILETDNRISAQAFADIGSIASMKSVMLVELL